MNEKQPLLQLSSVTVAFPTGEGSAEPVLDQIDLTLFRREVVALIGPSGCGKSLTGLAALGLTPPGGLMTAGRVAFGGADLPAPEADKKRIRGGKIALLFQEAETALNPVIAIGAHFKETLRTHRPETLKRWRNHASALLASVDLDPERTLKSYAHQLSGGQRQRALLAIALASEPDLLVADEPTSSLDLLTQESIIRLMVQQCRERAMALLLISHDLAIVGGIADRVAVMFAGRIVEEAPTRELIHRPLHPLSRALVAAALEASAPSEFARIPATRPTAMGCPCSTSCPWSERKCREELPPLLAVGSSRLVRCPPAVDRKPST